MSLLRTSRKRPVSDTVKNFIAEFPELKYDGAKIICLICNIPLMCWSKRDCQRHVNSKQHYSKKIGIRHYEKFKFNLCVTCILCNLPFHLLDDEVFVSLWNKYAEWKLPCRTSLRSLVPFAREHIEKRIKSELKDKKLWLCVAETTDRNEHSVVNVIVRTMESHQPSISILLASKRVENCTAEDILKVVLNSLNKFGLSTNQVLIFMSNGGASMLGVGRSLKERSGNFLHLTCKIHALNLVVQTICTYYPRVNALIASTKALFQKSPKRTRVFRRLSPEIPEPPQRIVTRWVAWLQAAFYYNKYFNHVKKIVLKFNSTEAAAIKKSQEIFQDTEIKRDLQTIHNNYFGLTEAIEKLQDVTIPLTDSVQIMNDVHAQLCAVEGEKNERIIEKFETVLDEDSDFLILTQICKGVSKHPLSCFEDYFKYANITSVDVERSFSALKNIYSARRTSLTEETVETYLMIDMFNRCYPLCDFTEDS